MKHFLEKNYRYIVAAVMAFVFVVSVLNAWNDSATFDEVAHIPAGYTYLTQNEMRLNPEHPPLVKDLSAVPLLFLNLNFDESQSFWTGDLPRKWDEGQWAAGRHLLYQAGNNPDQIIFWSRIPVVIISLILGLFLFKWGKEWFGVAGGLMVLALYAFDPNILGHNHYVTTDIGIAAFITFAFYYFLKFIKRPTWKNTFVGGLFLGLAFLAKFSSILFLPVFGLVLLIYPAFKKIDPGKKNFKETVFTKERLGLIGQYLGKGIIAFAAAMMIVWIVYAFNTFNTSREIMAQAVEFNFPSWDQNVKNLYTQKTLNFLNENSITRPLAAYGIGIGYVFRRVAGGNGAYFMGEVSSTAFPLYFPTVFLLKETLPFLFLILFSAGYALFRIMRTAFSGSGSFIKRNWEHFTGWLQHGVVTYTLFGFVLLYAYLSVTGNLNIGFRHLFPLLPFTYLLVTKQVYDFLRSHHERQRQNFAILAGVLVLWVVIGTIAAYPYYMSYFNPLAGGPHRGFRYVTDSNADWGQDLKRLKILLNKHPEIDKIRVDYFGGGDILKTIGEDKAILWWDSKRPIEPGWYAISVNFMMGSIYEKTKTADNSYRWTQQFQPIGQAGTSMLIYYLTEEDASSLFNL